MVIFQTCQVNGVKGNVHRMYEQLRKEGVLELVVTLMQYCYHHGGVDDHVD